MAGSPQHVTLVADTVTTVTFDYDFHTIEVLNVDGADEVYFTTDGTDPTIEGEGCEVLPAAISSLAKVRRGSANQGPAVVKLISFGTPKVSVAGRLAN